MERCWPKKRIKFTNNIADKSEKSNNCIICKYSEINGISKNDQMDFAPTKLPILYQFDWSSCKVNKFVRNANLTHADLKCELRHFRENI